MAALVQTVVGIPGAWISRTDIVTSIAKQSDGFLFAGGVIMNRTTQQGVKLEVYEHDPELPQAFARAGHRALTQADLDAIAAHTYTLYLVGQGGSVDAARRIMEIAVGLLKAGGIAVKVESTGIAHSARDWLTFAAHPEATALYHAYVVLIGEEGTYYSCGMHNLGLRDAIMSGATDAKTATSLLETFLLYTLLEAPTLRDGHTFSMNANAPSYRLTTEVGQTYPADSLFYNPFGMWRLSPKEY
jgi:Domain of unknown function (DUF4261)